MLLVAIAWIYVVLMVVLAQATGPDASLLGAFGTLLFWGVLPLGIVGYLAFAPARRRRRHGIELAAAAAASASIEASETASTESSNASGADPGRGGHAPGDPVAPERKES